MPVENLTKHDIPKVKIIVVEGEVVATMGPYMGVVEGYDQSGIKIAFTNGQSDYFAFTDIDADMKTLAALPVELRGYMKKDAGVDERTAQYVDRSGFDVEINEIPEAESEGMWDYSVVVTRQSDGKQMSEKVSGGMQVADNYADAMIQRFSSKRQAAEENPERPDRPSDAATSGGIADLVVGTHGGCLKFERPDKQAVCLHGLSRNVDGSGILHTAGPKGEDLDEPMTGDEMDAVSKATDSNDIASEGRMKMRIMADPQKNIVLLNTDGSPKNTFTTPEFIQALVTKGVRQRVADRLVEMALKSVGHFVEFVPSEEKARMGSLDRVAFSIYAVAPEGWEDVVKAIKKDQSENPSSYKGEGSPWAIAWAAKNKGYKRHGGKEASKIAMLEEYDTVQKPGSEERGEVVRVDPASGMATIRWHNESLMTTEESISELEKSSLPAVESEIITKEYLEKNFDSDDDDHIPDSEEGQMKPDDELTDRGY